MVLKISKLFLKKRFGNGASDKHKTEAVGANETETVVAKVDNAEETAVGEKEQEGPSNSDENVMQENDSDAPFPNSGLSNDEVREEPPSCDPTEDLIVEISHRDTASSYETEESYDDDEEDVTYFDNATLSVTSPQTGLRQRERTNYFHKDVVVSSLDVGTIGLVLRAMYFIPRPCASDHIVVKVEVRSFF